MSTAAAPDAPRLEVVHGVAVGLHGATIGLGSFLLFAVQPMIGKALLPLYGGTPAVWTTCMVFFQVVLLLGYCYAHVLARRVRPRAQRFVHLALLAAALMFLPLAVAHQGDTAAEYPPVLSLLWLLLGGVGGPYFILSSTAPLLQSWLSGSTARPYTLFAVSNIGSLLGLLSYPFLVEPAFTLETQSLLWSCGFAIFVLLCAIAALRTSTSPVKERTMPSESEGVPGKAQAALWFAFAACGTTMLLAVTNHMCQDIAVVPFLWVVPLTVYLMSFILTFSGRVPYSRILYLMGVTVALVLLPVLRNYGLAMSTLPLIVVYSVILFACCMLCHGEVYASRPAPAFLTYFYLIVVAGGAAGGVLVAIAAPLLLSRYVEMPLAIQGCYVLAVAALLRERDWRIFSIKHRPMGSLGLVAALAAFVLALGLVADSLNRNVLSVRNFFGVLHVTESQIPSTGEKIRILFHGTTMHGLQFLDPAKLRKPAAYYGEDSAVGWLLKSRGAKGRRIGVVGLGTGTLATYGRAGDTITFYEINPEVVRLARSQFTFLADSLADVSVVVGDARMTLQRASPAGFDVLVLDAFSGDAIPIHLLTQEAFAVYMRHLSKEGVIVVHISNRHLNLTPVLEPHARRYGMAYVEVGTRGKQSLATATTTYFLMTTDASLLDSQWIHDHRRKVAAPRSPTVLWTDDFSSLLRILS